MGKNVVLNTAQKPISVLHVIPSLSLVHGGPSRAIGLIEQSLLDEGVMVETATTDDDGPGRRMDRSLLEAINENGKTRRYFRKTLDRYKVSISLAQWLFAHVRDYDIVHIHSLFSFSSTAAAWAARRAGVPYVVRPLGTLATYGMTQRRPGPKRLSLALVEGSILRHAAAVHFTSDMERDEAASLGIPMRGAVIPLAVAFEETTNVEPLLSRYPGLRGKRTVLYLSRLDPKKNVEGLLNAIAHCIVELPEVYWLIAGDGAPNYVGKLHELAAGLALGDRVIWLGHIQGAEKAAAFAHVELFVLPSYSENFGIAAAEALQAGLPVVLGKGVALSALVADTNAGISTEPDPESIAIAMKHYLLDPTARAMAATHARALAAQEFSIATMGARLLALYKTILATSEPEK